jgi:hypothetical protein
MHVLPSLQLQFAFEAQALKQDGDIPRGLATLFSIISGVPQRCKSDGDLLVLGLHGRPLMPEAEPAMSVLDG